MLIASLILGCGIFGYGDPPRDTAPDTATPDTGTSDLASCVDATFFGSQPDFASAGTVVGRVASPSGHVPVSGARLSVTAEGKDAWTVSAEAGCFTLDLPPGTYTLELEKGRYTATRLATVVEGETVDLGELALDQGDLRLAVVHGKYDSVHLLIDELGIDFDTYTEPEDLFGDLELLNSYDAVFSNCGSTATTQNDAAYTPEQVANARAWVHAGGTLYTSDWEWELLLHHGRGARPDAGRRHRRVAQRLGPRTVGQVGERLVAGAGGRVLSTGLRGGCVRSQSRGGPP